jgi:hypothetical protein
MNFIEALENYALDGGCDSEAVSAIGRLTDSGRISRVVI